MTTDSAKLRQRVEQWLAQPWNKELEAEPIIRDLLTAWTAVEQELDDLREKIMPLVQVFEPAVSSRIPPVSEVIDKVKKQCAEIAHLREEHERLLREGTSIEGDLIRDKEQAEQQVIALRAYVQHKPRCASLHPRDRCRAHGGDGSINGCPVCQNMTTYPICSCGLADLLREGTP